MAALKARADVGHLPAPYVCHVEFHMRRPARPKYPWPSSGGDVDKLTRAVLDGLTRGRLIEDDRHVVLVDAVKVFGEPRTVVTVQCVEPVSACEQEAA